MAAYEPIPIKELKIKKGFEERYQKILGERYDEFLECSTSYIRKSIRVNGLKIGVKECVKRLSKNWVLEPIPWCKEGFWITHRREKRFDIGNTPEHQLGYIYVQDAASMLPPVVMKPKKGSVVLDLCASPGSKTTQLAAMMENQGVLIANDVQGSRIKPLGMNLMRCGTTNTIITQMSGVGFKKHEGRYDFILVDAPCSGTGTVRRSLKTLQMWSPGLVKKMAGIQKQLLLAASTALKPGGVLVYSTCTLEPEEDEGMVSNILELTDLETEDIKLDIVRSDPVVEWEGKEYADGVRKCLRIYPQDNDTEGFFVARMRKKK